MKFLSNTWVVTLTATLIGVFLALYLNELVASRKLHKQKSIATQNVLSEIASNNEKLKEAAKKHLEILDIIEFLNYHSDEENALVAHKDSLNQFRLKYPDIINIEDSTLIDDDVYDYNGEINMDFSLPQLEITSIAWNTLKDSGIASTYGFECLMYLESIDNIVNEVKVKNKELFDYFFSLREMGDKTEYLILHLNLVIDFEQTLSEIYDRSEEQLKDCG